jgi:hypothetical protein
MRLIMNLGIPITFQKMFVDKLELFLFSNSVKTKDITITKSDKYIQIDIDYDEIFHSKIIELEEKLQIFKINDNFDDMLEIIRKEINDTNDKNNNNYNAKLSSAFNKPDR